MMLGQWKWFLLSLHPAGSTYASTSSPEWPDGHSGELVDVLSIG